MIILYLILIILAVALGIGLDAAIVWATLWLLHSIGLATSIVFSWQLVLVVWLFLILFGGIGGKSK